MSGSPASGARPVAAASTRTATADPEAVAREVPPRRRRQSAWLPTAAYVACALLALGMAYIAFQAVRARLGGSPLRAATDVIGYNTVNNFNAGQYLQTFYAGAVGAPLLAIAVFVVLRLTLGRMLTAVRAAPVPLLPPARRLATAPREDPAVLGGRRVAWLRCVAFVAAPGTVLGLALAVERGPDQGSFWAFVATGTGLYVAIVLALAAGIHLLAPRSARRPRSSTCAPRRR